MSPQTSFNHGDLPARVAPSLRCPAVTLPTHAAWPGYVVEPVEGSGYRVKLRCSECFFEWTASEAQLRRFLP